MRCLSTVVILLSLSASTGWSQTTPFFPFEDTFDGPIDDDEPVTWMAGGTSGGMPPTLTTNNGDLILSDPVQFDGYSLGLTIVSKDNGFVIAENTSAQAVVRVTDDLAFASIWTNGQAIPPDGDGGAFFANIRGDGVINIGNFIKPNTWLQFPTGLNAVANDVVFQLDTADNTVTASAWLAGQPKPDSPPSVTFIDDDARPPGTFGLGGGRFTDDATGVSATFRSFQIVPEPSTVSLAALGMLGLLGFRRRLRRC